MEQRNGDHAGQQCTEDGTSGTRGDSIRMLDVCSTKVHAAACGVCYGHNALKASTSDDRLRYTRLEQLPNVGKATAGDLRRLGIQEPQQLIGRDPYALYDELCRITGQRHDPCVMDVLIAVVRFMEGGPATPWWHFTPERKLHMARRAGRS